MKGHVTFRLAMLVAAALIANVVGFGTATASTTTQESVVARSSPLAPLGPVAKHPKLDTHLLAAATAAEGTGGVSDGLRVAREQGVAVSGNSVRVVVASAGGRSAARAGLSAIGGRVEAEYADVIQAFVPVGALRKLADLAVVSYVGLPVVPVADATTDEGVAASNANTWQAAGVTGAGVKVGIIDLGFAGYTTAQTTGDLPGSLTTQDYCGGALGSPESHGTAVAEIVHKMAPAAQLYLICVNSSVTLGNAKDYVITQGITIVNFSDGFFNSGRGDGTGVASSPDAIVADARAHGILWVNAAGNYGQRHWSGTFIDANADLWHDFASGDELDDIVINAGFRVCVFLKWDSWPTSAQDFDVYLFRVLDFPTTPVAGSENFQTGSQPPTEQFCYTNATGVSQYFGIAIRKYSATVTPRFDLFVDSGAPQYVVAAGSLTEPASSPNAMAAGAICFSTNALEPFSSQGPTIDGRIKPDIAGQDATSSPVYGAGGCGGSGGSGSSGFTGTSASSPHVAGAAALVAQANPTFTPAQLQLFLEGRAVDLGTGGKDNQYGEGKLWLGAVPPPPSISASPSPITAGNSLSVTFAGIIGPTGGDWIALQPTSYPDGSYIAWRLTGGAASGTVSLTVPASAAPGSYNVRLFLNNSNTSTATSAALTVNAATSNATISASPSPITAGGVLSITFGGIASPTGGDWISLQPTTYPDGSYIAWRFTGGTASGTVTLTVPASATAGSYNVRLFLNNSNISTGTSNSITVSAATSAAPTVTGISPATGPTTGGTPVTITGTGFAAGATVTIGGISATSVTLVNATSISATTPSHAPGAVDVVVTNMDAQFGTCSGCFTYAATSSVTISASPSTITAGNDLTITFSGIGVPTNGDWIGLQPTTYPDGSYIAWRFTGGTAGGTVTLTVPASATAGTYNVRLFLNNSNTSTATSTSITVNAAVSSATISAGPSPITAGSDLTIMFSGIGAPTNGDWIALQPTSYPDGSYIAWRFTGGTAGGTVTLTVPASATSGTYNVRLFLNFSNTSTATSNSITVNAAASSATISASPTTIAAGGELTITFSAIANPTAGDWIGLQPTTYPDGSYIAWRFTGGTASGMVTLTVPISADPGSYNVRLFLNNSNTSTAASNAFTVN